MKVFYSDRMVANSHSFSPSASKPSKAVASWLASRFDIEIVEPTPVDCEQLYRAHDPDYVDGVLSCKIANGFGNKSMSVAKSLPYTSGAMLDAAKEALMSGNNTCAPVSGFHHAKFDRGGGFCTFNGLMVTALDLIESDDVRVGILDCDQHYGDGTDDIIRRLGIDSRIQHYTAGKHKHNADEFLNNLSSLVKSFSDCDVLLYQACADPHINDPLGGWMTTEQLKERDRLVFQTSRDLGLPVGWCLAGGYQRDANGGIAPVLEIHNNTMIACLRSVGTLATNQN